MIEQTPIWILCPGCECAIRILSKSPCPNCQRCAFCGNHLKATGTACDCQASNEKLHVEESFLKDFVIPDDQVAHETRRMEIRKQLEMKKAIAGGILGGLWVLSPLILSDIIKEKTWLTYYLKMTISTLLLLCLASALQWVFSRIEDHRLEMEHFE